MSTTQHLILDKLYKIVNSDSPLSPTIASHLNLYYEYLSLNMPNAAAEEMCKAAITGMYYEMQNAVEADGVIGKKCNYCSLTVNRPCSSQSQSNGCRTRSLLDIENNN